MTTVDDQHFYMCCLFLQARALIATLHLFVKTLQYRLLEPSNKLVHATARQPVMPATTCQTNTGGTPPARISIFDALFQDANAFEHSGISVTVSADANTDSSLTAPMNVFKTPQAHTERLFTAPTHVSKPSQTHTKRSLTARIHVSKPPQAHTERSLTAPRRVCVLQNTSVCEQITTTGSSLTGAERSLSNEIVDSSLAMDTSPLYFLTDKDICATRQASSLHCGLFGAKCRHELKCISTITPTLRYGTSVSALQRKSLVSSELEPVTLAPACRLDAGVQSSCTQVTQHTQTNQTHVCDAELQTD